jgi:wobble nucleotide-excising tRNase
LRFTSFKTCNHKKLRVLESINIKKIATYDEAGIQITDLKKVNFIYGANASGKTTITKVIANPTDIRFADCSLVWQNNLPIEPLVYNKDFRENNFGKGKLNGVFTLGQATNEEIAAIALMQVELDKIRENGIKKRETLDKQVISKQQVEEDFRDSIWESIFKEYETDFKEAFVGFQKRETFKTKLISEFQTNITPLKTYEAIKEKSETIFGEVPTTLNLITVIDIERLLAIESDAIWQKKIIGKTDVAIAQLIQKLNLNDWVNEGRKYLQDDETCPFCQQETITEDFRKQLENYFDETFTTDTALVKSNTDEYNLLAENLSNVLIQIEATEKANDKTKLNTETFSAYLKTLSSQFISNKELLNNKIKEPSRSIDLISVKEQLENIKQLITNANALLAIHNAIVANYPAERTELITSIWKLLVEENTTNIEAYKKKSDGLQKGINNLGIQRTALQASYCLQRNQIVTANRNVTSVQPSVDEINRILKFYEFVTFEIVPSRTERNAYQIQRDDGTIAEDTLSEGEITFITFLYFLQRAKGSTLEETISDDRILVVDDPISSLDSNILFIISSLLKEIIREVKSGEGHIKQLILLTHNVYFHKEVSFINGRTKEDGETYFWILRRKNKVSAIQNFELKNPIRNSYELLWQELKSRNNISDVTIQNTMRRIIENYFKILGRYADDQLINSFTNLQDQAICRSLICWINDVSHSIPDDLFIEHQELIIDKYFEVFKKVFYQMGHREHYDMMMREHETLTAV